MCLLNHVNTECEMNFSGSAPRMDFNHSSQPILEYTESHLNTLKNDQSYHCRKIDQK